MNKSDPPAIRRRNRLKHHFTMTSNVLLFGYATLTDAEKITYQIIDSFDWADGAGVRKGYAYPSEKRVAEARRLDERTIRRHFGALERAGLLTRELRPGQPSILWIEDPSTDESERYLSTVAIGPDTDVRDTPDAGVRPYKEDKGQGRQNLVNAGKERSQKQRAKTDWLAGEMLRVLGDRHSLGFYRKVAHTLPAHKVFEALSEVRLADREGRVRTSKGALFVGLIRKHQSSAPANLDPKLMVEPLRRSD